MNILFYMFKWIWNLQFRLIISFLNKSFSPSYDMIKRAKFPINHKPLTL